MDLVEPPRPTPRQTAPIVVRPSPPTPTEAWAFHWTGDDLQIWQIHLASQATLIHSLPTDTPTIGQVWTALQRQIRHPPPHLTEIATAYYALSRQLPLEHEDPPFTHIDLAYLYTLFHRYDWDFVRARLPPPTNFATLLRRSEHHATPVRAFIHERQRLPTTLSPIPRPLTPRHPTIEVIFTPDMRMRPYSPPS